MKKQPIPRSLIESAKQDLVKQMTIRTLAISQHTGLSKEFCARLVLREVAREGNRVEKGKISYGKTNNV